MNPSSSTNSVALITGASRGVGVALARALLSSGWRVDVLSRSDAGLRAAYADGIRTGRVRVLPADITDATAVKSLAKLAYAEDGPSDLLFNNAGRFVSMAPISDSDPAGLVGRRPRQRPGRLYRNSNDPAADAPARPGHYH